MYPEINESILIKHGKKKIWTRSANRMNQVGSDGVDPATGVNQSIGATSSADRAANLVADGSCVFLDTVSGNDSNSGLTRLLPKKTYAAAETAAAGGGKTGIVLLNGGATLSSFGGANTDTISYTFIQDKGSEPSILQLSRPFFGTYTSVVPAGSPSARGGVAWMSDPLLNQNGFSYFYGGKSGSSYYSDFYHYRSSPFEDFIPIATSNSPGARWMADMCVHKGYVYLFGGRGNATNYLNTMYNCIPSSIDWVQNTWTSDGPAARSHHAMVSYFGKIYLYGGKNASSPFDDFWEYDDVASEWTQVSASGISPNVQGGCRMFNFKGYLWLYGISKDSSSKCELWKWSLQSGWQYVDSVYYSSAPDRPCISNYGSWLFIQNGTGIISKELNTLKSISSLSDANIAEGCLFIGERRIYNLFRNSAETVSSYYSMLPIIDSHNKSIQGFILKNSFKGSAIVDCDIYNINNTTANNSPVYRIIGTGVLRCRFKSDTEYNMVTIRQIDSIEKSELPYSEITDLYIESGRAVSIKSCKLIASIRSSSYSNLMIYAYTGVTTDSSVIACGSRSYSGITKTGGYIIYAQSVPGSSNLYFDNSSIIGKIYAVSNDYDISSSIIDSGIIYIKYDDTAMSAGDLYPSLFNGSFSMPDGFTPNHTPVIANPLFVDNENFYLKSIAGGDWIDSPALALGPSVTAYINPVDQVTQDPTEIGAYRNYYGSAIDGWERTFRLPKPQDIQAEVQINSKINIGLDGTPDVYNEPGTAIEILSMKYVHPLNPEYIALIEAMENSDNMACELYIDPTRIDLANVVLSGNHAAGEHVVTVDAIDVPAGAILTDPNGNEYNILFRTPETGNATKLVIFPALVSALLDNDEFTVKNVTGSGTYQFIPRRRTMKRILKTRPDTLAGMELAFVRKKF
jgi:hypothetical protein